MSIIHTDGFSSYSASTDMAAYGWSLDNTSSVTIEASGGYSSAPAVRLNGINSVGSFQMNVPMKPPSTNEIRMGFWWQGTASIAGGSSTVGGVSLIDSNFAFAGYLGTNATGRVCWTNFRGYPSTNIAYDYSGINAINDGQWHWIELQLILGTGTAGTIKVWVDGVLEINQVGVSTSGSSGVTSCVNLGFFSLSNLQSTGTSTNYTRFSHVVIWDADTAGLNGYAGPMRIETLTPNGAGSNTGFTASSGSNYACVDETVANGDSDYVEAATSGTIDTYTYTDLSVTPNAIKGVNVKTYMKNPDTGLTKTARAKCKSGATTGSGSDRTLSIIYDVFHDSFDKDPNTSAAWTRTNLNAAEFGIEART